ncbi:MAG: bifunctional metallophosphatase/5'-nucleotidase [Myxococcota bacterium]
MKFPRLGLRTCATGMTLALGCAGTPISPRGPNPTTTTSNTTLVGLLSTKPTTTRVTLLHTSDNESELLGSERGDDSAVATGGIGRAISLMRVLRERVDGQPLILAAGDTWMPAPELHLEVEKKSAVITGNNLLGYQASALGNHEWDLGETFLADQLAHVSFPYLSATIDIHEGPLAARAALADAPPMWAREAAGRILPSVRVCLGNLRPSSTPDDVPSLARCDGTVIGAVGATTEDLRSITNVPRHVGLATNLEETRQRIQQQVDRFTADGIDIIVLISHLQDVNEELKLIDSGLVGVDLVIAGGGDNRLANLDHRLLAGDEADPVCREQAQSCYPLLRRARDGRPVAIVATDGQLRYIGALDAGFDDDGVLSDIGRVSRPWPVDEASLREVGAAIAADALHFEDQVQAVLTPRMTPFADVAVFLEGRREEVRNRQTNLGDLSADAMRWAGREGPQGEGAAWFALRNGGGIRAPIGRFDNVTYAREGGPLRPIDVESALRFDGDLVVVQSTHRALRETLEAALRGAGTGRGQFPQVSREVYLEYSRSKPEQVPHVIQGRAAGVLSEGQRVRTLRITLEHGDVVDVVKDGITRTPDAKITFVTLGFLARGGDGWFPGSQSELNVQPLVVDGQPIREQRNLQDYVESMVRAGTWQGGTEWPDPVPSKPESFTRIRELSDDVTLPLATSRE